MAEINSKLEPEYLPGNYQYGLHHENLRAEMLDPVRSAMVKPLDLEQLAIKHSKNKVDKRFEEIEKMRDTSIDDYITNHPLETQGKSRTEIRGMMNLDFSSFMEIQKQQNNKKKRDIIDLALSRPHKWISYKGELLPTNTIFKTEDENIYVETISPVIDIYNGVPVIEVLVVSDEFVPYKGNGIKQGEKFKVKGEDMIYTAPHGIYTPYFMGSLITHVKRGGTRKPRRKQRKSKRSRR